MAAVAIGEKDRVLWRKLKRNGNFSKKKKLMLKSIGLPNPKVDKSVKTELQEPVPVVEIHTNKKYNKDDSSGNISERDSDDELDNEDDEDYGSCNFSSRNHGSDHLDLLDELRSWAINFQIKHAAINSLLVILKSHIADNVLPKDARTLVKTPRVTTISKDERLGGQYWHYGLKRILLDVVSNNKEIRLLSLNVNIDGLPTYKSSTTSFWPILVNVDELRGRLPPSIVGIFCGLCTLFVITLINP